MGAFFVVLLGLLWPVEGLTRDYVILDKGDGSVSYAELFSLRRTTEGALVWRVDDFRHPDMMGHLSKLYLEEIDCVGRRARTRSERRYSGKRATGRPTSIARVDSSWRALKGEGGPDGILLRTVCPRLTTKN
jgi:hypothetical protein